MKSLLIISLFMLGLSANAHSSVKERSYVVTKANDTIYGRVKVNRLIGGLKLITADSIYKLDPNKFTAYYDAKTKALYRSKILPGFVSAELMKKMSIPEHASWLKCIEDGKIKLYEHKSSTFGYSVDNVVGATTTVASIVAAGGIPNSEFTAWYVEKDGSVLTPIKYNSFTSAGSKTRKERKELLKNLLVDNDKVSQSYAQSKSFTFGVVKTLVHEYNNPKS